MSSASPAPLKIRQIVLLISFQEINPGFPFFYQDWFQSLSITMDLRIFKKTLLKRSIDAGAHYIFSRSKGYLRNIDKLFFGFPSKQAFGNIIFLARKKLVSKNWFPWFTWILNGVSSNILASPNFENLQISKNLGDGAKFRSQEI